MPDGPGTAMVTRVALVDSARRTGRAVWLERRLYEAVGAWASEASDAAATVALAVQAQRHAERATAWFDRLPELRELPAEDLVAPTPAAAALLDALGEPADDPARAAALARVVLPAARAAYAAMADDLSPVADGPSLRLARRVVEDLGGEASDLAEVSASASPPSNVAALVAALDPAAAGGGLLGPVDRMA